MGAYELADDDESVLNGDVVQALRVVLAADPARLQRLGEAGTSVRFSVRGEPRSAATLLLDRVPPEVTTREDAEITIELDPVRLPCFLAGRLVLAIALVEGSATCWGPARKYLTVDPIVRGLLSAAARG